jgi:chromosome segregation ATPase
MLKTLRIKNFQKFDKMLLEFSPTLTTIIGSSDSGKSSLFRALQWVVLNRPSGVGFIKHGTDDTRVRLTTDRHRIERSRIGSDNAYFLDGEKYKSFSTSVPEDLQKALGMTSLNFQSQHEPLFWFSLSPSALSSEINRLVDLDSIDYVNKKLRAKDRSVSLQIEKRQESIETCSKALRALEGIEDLEQDWSEIEKMVQSLKQIEIAIDYLEQSAVLLDKLITSTSTLKGVHAELELLAGLETELEEIDRSLKDLSVLSSEINLSRSAVRALTQDYEKALTSSKVCPTCGKTV